MSRLWGGEFLGILFLLSSCGHRQVLPSGVLADTVSWRSGDSSFGRATVWKAISC
ncbi:hypothetical protein [Hoylesella saccharolytica]|uniref:hypothetical protein n=1 Tax=Hoylesella saccharolytica TaxID=633701 RepID=UPI001F228E26|nr:hypothetical protein [Hoylesella saccharolytica]